MPVYFIDSGAVRGDSVKITGPLAHHLKNVLRMKPGETLDLVDQSRTRYRAAIASVDRSAVTAAIHETRAGSPPSGPKIRLVACLLKGKKMDLLIQKATELGVGEILPVVSRRTVARPDAARSGHQADRWREIAKEAAQQSSRLESPVVAEPTTLEAFLGISGAAAARVVLWEEDCPPLKTVLSKLKTPREVTVLVGPEGGFDPVEIREAKKAGFQPASLGEAKLRAETATYAVLSILQYEFAGTADKETAS